MKTRVLLLTIAIIAVVFTPAFAYTVPQDDSRVKYFYVFGPQGNPLLGAEEPEFILYIDVPVTAAGQVLISVYDPDTGGALDMRLNLLDPWDTVTEFAVYGKGRGALGKKEFGESKGYDGKYYTFGPYPKEAGRRVGGYFRFKLVAKTISGDDENLFNVKISPENAEAFVHKMTFRLIEKKDEKMYFYPLIPVGTTKITVGNYDIDRTGGRSVLIDPKLNVEYAIKDSQSGKWAETVISMDMEQTRPLQYVIKKKTQVHGNAGLRVADQKGNPIAVYFRQPPEQPIAAPLDECNNKFVFDATSSYDSDNGALTYLWDFGDGATSDQPVVVHEYEKGGEYTVKLTVRNDSGLECDTSETLQVIKVNTPPVADFSMPEKICVDQEFALEANATDDNTAAESLIYKWDFGDGAKAEGKQATKSYKAAGAYNVKLTADDNTGTACSVAAKEKVIKVYAPPVVNAGEDIDLCLSGSDEYRVAFSAKDVSGSGDLTYSWDFGDGDTTTGKSVTHVYKKSGTYNVTLTADNWLGLPCSSCQDSLIVTLNRKPIANAGPNLVCCIDKVSVFDASGSSDPDGDSLTYIWDFGDGVTAEGVKVEHTYTKIGKYTVTLVVKDDSGKPCDTATSSFIASINDRPVSIIELK